MVVNQAVLNPIGQQPLVQRLVMEQFHWREVLLRQPMIAICAWTLEDGTLLCLLIQLYQKMRVLPAQNWRISCR